MYGGGKYLGADVWTQVTSMRNSVLGAVTPLRCVGRSSERPEKDWVALNANPNPNAKP